MSQKLASNHEALLQRLHEQVEHLFNSEGWQRWLRTASRFRTYSLHNQLLIIAQRPDATRVAGLRTWNELGRRVRRGERGIAIFAPIVHRSIDENTGDAKRSVKGFRIVHVFDLAQTEGDPMPDIEFPAVRVSDEALLDRLLEATKEAELDVAWVPAIDAGEARGWYTSLTRTITLVSDYPTASQARTLLHELAHHCDPVVRDNGPVHLVRSVCEIVAESAAYIVGTSLGIDMQDASATYLASWAGWDLGTDRKVLEQAADHVLRVAADFEALVTPVLTRT